MACVKQGGQHQSYASDESSAFDATRAPTVRARAQSCITPVDLTVIRLGRDRERLLLHLAAVKRALEARVRHAFEFPNPAFEEGVVFHA